MNFFINSSKIHGYKKVKHQQEKKAFPAIIQHHNSEEEGEDVTKFLIWSVTLNMGAHLETELNV